LIEVMMVVAIIAIMAAVAVPNLLPEVHKAHVGGGAEVVAAAVARARSEAMVSKRCVRVWIDSTNTHRTPEFL
jgi:Tfp pilus assembly protein FimT